MALRPSSQFHTAVSRVTSHTEVSTDTQTVKTHSHRLYKQDLQAIITVPHSRLQGHIPHRGQHRHTDSQDTQSQTELTRLAGHHHSSTQLSPGSHPTLRSAQTHRQSRHTVTECSNKTCRPSSQFHTAISKVTSHTEVCTDTQTVKTHSHRMY